MTPEELAILLTSPEDERLEFKRLQTGGSFDALCKYVAGISNSGGGTIVLGVSDLRPRRIEGTLAFPEPGKTKAQISRELRIEVRMEEHTLENKRVLLVLVPARPAGRAISDRGKYWHRVGEELLPMPDDVLARIHGEVESDFSAQSVDGSSFSDLDVAMVAKFRSLLVARSRGGQLPASSDIEMLQDAELLSAQGYLTHAAVLLLGARGVISRLIPQAEIILEFRSAEAAGPSQDRVEFRGPLLATLTELWDRINQRNDRQSIQEGFFRRDIFTFDEAVVRESILNAVTHRSYRDQSSILIRQFARRLEVASPGGFPVGVTVENLLAKQVPRNRLLAEALQRVGLVERAGQGVNLMYERSVQQGKRTPDYSRSDATAVQVVLDGTVSCPQLVAALERVGQEQLIHFSTEDFIVLDRLQRGEEVPPMLLARLPLLRERGLVESVGRGRGARYLLSRRLSDQVGQSGAYTRRKGLDRGQSAALLLAHLRSKGAEGAAMAELQQVLPSHSRSQIHQLLAELQASGDVRLVGAKRWARWLSVGSESQSMSAKQARSDIGS